MPEPWYLLFGKGATQALRLSEQDYTFVVWEVVVSMMVPQKKQFLGLEIRQDLSES